MEEKIEAMLKKYSNEQIQSFLYSFFKIKFTKNEIDQIMPIVRAEWRDAVNPKTRDALLKKVELATSTQTMSKINQVIDIVVNYYGFKL